MKIQTISQLKSCITDGSREIPVGTLMEKSGSYLQWTYFKGSGFTLIIMGFESEDWKSIKKLN